MGRGVYDRKRLEGMPLRKVIRTYTKFERHGVFDVPFEMELLECGHEIRRKRDMYGLTNAYKRRCYKCKNNAPKDVQ